jgi:hypothetical protein
VNAARSSTQLTRANVNDQPFSFTIKVERIKDGKKGARLRFHVAVKAKAAKAGPPADAKEKLPPRHVGVLEVADGEAVIATCNIQPEEVGGEETYSFEVAAKYAEKSSFTFGEVTGGRGGAEGRYYWFYLKDFEDPLPGEKAPLPELAKACKGALVATLLEVGKPQLGPPGASDYDAKWKVEKVLRGEYPATAELSFRVQSMPEKSRERLPEVGKTYVLITYEVNANQIAAVLEADDKNLRRVQDALSADENPGQKPKFDAVLRDKDRFYFVLARPAGEKLTDSLAAVGEHLEAALKPVEDVKGDLTIAFFLRTDPKAAAGSYSGFSRDQAKAIAALPADKRAAKLLEHNWAFGELPKAATPFPPQEKGKPD